MISKNEVKYIQSLYQKKTRDKEKVFIAEGPKLTGELLKAGINIKKIYAVESWAAAAVNIQNITIVTQDELNKLSNQQTPNQVVAVVQQPVVTTEPELVNTVSLVLDGIQDPGNMGTIIRIADWFGIYQVIASTDSTDIYNPKVVQATMGSLFRVKVWYKPIEEWLQHVSVDIYGAMLNGENVLTAPKLSEGLLVIGSEGRGIRPAILPFIKKALTIPGRGAAESLNAAVATGIILSHVL